MAKIDYTVLSEEMKNAVSAFKNSGEDAIYLLGSGKSFNTKAIISRIQATYLNDIYPLNVKTVESWKNCDSYLTEINTQLPPVTTTNEFSSFALKERIDFMGRLRYPLCKSFATTETLFLDNRFIYYTDLIEKVQNAYRLKIIELTDAKKVYEYKKVSHMPELKNAYNYSINNQLEPTISTLTKSVIKLGTQYQFTENFTYRFSQQEKFVSVVDTLARHTIRFFAKKEGSKLTSDELFIGRLYAEILLSRAINYGNKDNNRNIEASLTLQMSNAFARVMPIEKVVEKSIELGKRTAMSVITKLGLSLEEVKQCVKDSGYVYRAEPKSYMEALILTRAATQENVDEVQIESYVIEDSSSATIYSQNIGNYVISQDTTQTPVNNGQNAEEQVVENSSNESEEKITTKKDLQTQGNIKESRKVLTRKSVVKYIDQVIDKTFKKQADVAAKQIFDPLSSQKKVVRMQRKYNFIDHMQSFYDRKKDCSLEDIKNILEQEQQKSLDDLYFAHSFSNSFIELKTFIVSSLFGENTVVEKKEGMSSAVLVNNFSNQNYEKPFTVYINDNLTKSIIEIFNEIDNKTFKPKDIAKAKERE